MFKFTNIPFVQKLVGFFKQGTSPHGLAASTTLGIVLGVFPILGVTTWMSTLIGVRFKLNVPLVLAVLYLVWPIQIGLIIPFLRAGEWLFAAPPFALSLEKVQLAFEADFFGALRQFWDANLYALAGWSMLALPIGVLIYYLLFYLFKYFMNRRTSNEQTHTL